MKKLFPTFLDETAQLYEKIYFSAGTRGMQLYMDPADLISVAEAEYADLI
jgi:Cys-tRNA(Pro)/Cys-tRNA(Cys) deacylase